MTDSQLIGFGEQLPECEPSCFTQIDAYNYGLGVVRSGRWMLQNPQLSGYSAVEAYLPSTGDRDLGREHLRARAPSSPTGSTTTRPTGCSG